MVAVNVYVFPGLRPCMQTFNSLYYEIIYFFLREIRSSLLPHYSINGRIVWLEFRTKQISINRLVRHPMLTTSAWYYFNAWQPLENVHIIFSEMRILFQLIENHSNIQGLFTSSTSTLPCNITVSYVTYFNGPNLTNNSTNNSYKHNTTNSIENIN